MIAPFGNVLNRLTTFTQSLVDDWAGEGSAARTYLAQYVPERLQTVRTASWDTIQAEARRSWAKVVDVATGAPSLAINAVRYGLLPSASSAFSTVLREGAADLHWKTVGDALVRFAQHSGPVLTKLGQILATRTDALPGAVCDRLQALYSRQPPMTEAQLQALLELAYPKGLPFRMFDRQPVAVGSIGQVHRGELLTGERVMVKLLRPGIERAIDRDLHMVEFLLDLLLRIPRSTGRGARKAASQALRDLGTALRTEVDLLAEADALEDFRRRFRDNPRVRVPIVHRPLCSAHVLVMEELCGEPLSAFRARAKTDPEAARKVASLAVREILSQVFDEGRFHADPHAGNLLVMPDGRLGLIDLGLVGELGPADRKRLGTAVRAFVSGDPDQLTRTLLEFGTLPPDFDFETFKRDIIAVVREHEAIVTARVTGRTGGEVDGDRADSNRLERFVNDLFRVAYSHDLYVPRTTILLIKTLVTIEGVGRSLDPSMNIVTTAIPIVLRSLAPRWLRWRFW